MPWTKKKNGHRILPRGRFRLQVVPLSTDVRWGVIAYGRGPIAVGFRRDMNIAKAKQDCYQKYESLRRSG